MVVKKSMKKKARWLIMKILHPKEPKFICENHNKYSWLMKLKLHITKKHADYSWFFNYSFIQLSWWFPRTCPFSCDGSRNWNDIDTNINISTTIRRYELDKIYARFSSSNSNNFSCSTRRLMHFKLCKVKKVLHSSATCLTYRNEICCS